MIACEERNKKNKGKKNRHRNRLVATLCVLSALFLILNLWRNDRGDVVKKRLKINKGQGESFLLDTQRSTRWTFIAVLSWIPPTVIRVISLEQAFFQTEWKFLVRYWEGLHWLALRIHRGSCPYWHLNGMVVFCFVFKLLGGRWARWSI